MEAFTLQARLELEKSGFSNDLATIEGELNSGSNLSAFSAWGTTIGNLASGAFRRAFSAGVQFAKDVVNKTMNFEEVMSGVQSVTQASSDDMERLSAKAMELGGSTIFTAEQVGEAMFYMGQAGWSTEQILSGIGGVMDLAAASGDDLARVSDIVTDSINNFNLTADETGHYVDVLAQTARNSNTNISMMGEAFKYVSPVAKMLNYSIEDVALALGLAANNGIKASQAGTSLRSILNNIIRPSDDAAAAMTKWGISIDDGTGKIKPFVEVMADFRQAVVKAGYDPSHGRSIEEIAAAEEKYASAVEAADEALASGLIDQAEHTARVNEALDDYEAFTHFNRDFLADISDIAGLRGLSTLLAIMNATEGDYQRVQGQIEQAEGAAAQMAETKRDNLKGDITLFNSAVDNLQLTLGEEVNEPLRNLVQTGTSFVSSLTSQLTAGQGKLDANQMERILKLYEEWDSIANWQFITKNNKALELTRAIAEELEAAGATEEEVAHTLANMREAGNAEQLLEMIKTLGDAKTAVAALGSEADAVAGDYDLNFHINTTGDIPRPHYIPGGGVGGSGKDTYVSLNAKGAWDTPYDNYLASLHRDEMVLTATQARQYRDGQAGGGLSADDVAAIVGAVMRNTALVFNDEVVGRTFGDATTGRVNDNMTQTSRSHRYGYGG
jgi:TP901 family phage tail tape measure protein